MKKSIKSQINSLLSGKKDIPLIVLNPEPGVYQHDGKTYNEADFQALTEGYEKVIVLTFQNWHQNIPVTN